jgi:hypothetical protein
VTNAKLASDIDASKLTTGTLPIARIADSAVTAAKLSQPLTLATAVATTSGIQVDFTGIPSWAKRITVMLSGVSTNGVSMKLIQLGTSSGVAMTGYTSTANFVGASNTTGASNVTSGFLISSTSASDSISGAITLLLVGSNTWVASGLVKVQQAVTILTSGDITLSGTLDRVRLSTINGTDTFDAGSVNIMYEG